MTALLQSNNALVIFIIIIILIILINCRVSSVLNKDTKQYGKRHMFDGQAETCWNSDEVRSTW